MNPRKMQQAMKQLGIQQDDLPAKRVEITLEDKKLVFENPDVQKVDMMGQETYQVVGKPQEHPLEKREVVIDDEDIETVVQQTGCTEDEAKEAIKENDYDLAEAILSLQ
jgi:nascent polypeptide-associated complex subunit alpha